MANVSANTSMNQFDAWGQPSSPANCEKKSIAANLNREMIKEKALAHQDTLVQLAGISTFIGFIYLFFSDGDFSFLLTLSSILSLASFVKVAWVIMTKQSVAGVSCRMMECYVIAFFSRLVSIMWMDGYLPYDSSGDYVYRISELGCFAISCLIVYFCREKFKMTYDDLGDNLPSWYLILPCIVLGLLFHPHLNGYMLCDVAWSQGLYLEAVACLPQLVLFRRQKKVESFTTNFLMTQILVRVFSFIFWASSSRDLHSYHLEGSIRAYASSMVVVMQVLQILVMADFVYQYIKCWRMGVPLNFIVNDVV